MNPLGKSVLHGVPRGFPIIHETSNEVFNGAYRVMMSPFIRRAIPSLDAATQHGLALKQTRLCLASEQKKIKRWQTNKTHLRRKRMG